MSVYNEIESERVYQRERWGNANDDNAALEDWVAWIAHHSSRWFPGGFAPHSRAVTQDFRKQMVKVAALAVAAIEAVDRKEAVNH